MSDKHAIVMGKTIKSKDIVRVKFKRLEEILAFFKTDSRRSAEIFDALELDYHLTTLVNGGIFFVRKVISSEDKMDLLENGAHKNQKDYKRPHEIELVDHNHDSDIFRINEHMIESIDVIDNHSDSFFSDKFQLSLVRVDGNLIINGEPLQLEDRKLLEILEKTISDLSIRSMFDSPEED